MARTMLTVSVVVVLFSMVLFAACGKKAEPPVQPPQISQEDASREATVSKEDVKKEAEEVLEAAKVYTQQQKDVYQSKIEIRMNELDRRLNLLRGKAQESSAEAKVKLDAEIEELEKKRQAAGERLAELREAAGQKLDDLKLELDEILASLEEKLNDLLPPME